MPNTFDAVPESARALSAAFLPLDQPADRLESIMDEAQLHRGSLREQDGYTIPFREGGQVRIHVVGDRMDSDGAERAGIDEDGDQSGLRFVVKAPNDERRSHIEQIIGEQVAGQVDDGVSLDWQRD